MSAISGPSAKGDWFEGPTERGRKKRSMSESDSDEHETVTAADSSVFDDTPLGGYLRDTGLDDWGIDSWHGEAKEIVDGKSGPAGPLPLALCDRDGKPARAFRRAKLLRLIREALKPKLDAKENAEFLERFRFVLVRSRLLDAGSAAHRLGGPTKGIMDEAEERRKDILFGDSGPWDIVKTRRRYWVGGGGVIVAVTVLVGSYAKRAADSPASATATLVVVLCVSLFLYAHSRRRLLRMLRAKAIAHASRFAEQSIALDRAVVRCVSLIREVEVLSLGFRPDLAAPGWDDNDDAEELGMSEGLAGQPAGEPTGQSTANTSMASASTTKHYAVGPSDIGSQASVQTGKLLRSAVAAALYLGCTAFIDAIKDTLRHCSELDLQRYFDLYELGPQQAEFAFVMNDDGVGFSRGFPARSAFYGSAGAHATVAELRHELRRLAFLRRAFMCCLLSVCTSGDVTQDELDTWSTVVDHLEQTCALSSRLAQTVSKESLVPGREDAEEIASSARPRNPALVDMSVTLQHLQARVALLAEGGPPDEWGGHSPDTPATDLVALGEDIDRLRQLFDKLTAGPSAPTRHRRNDTAISTATTMVPDDVSVYSEAADFTQSPRSSIVSFSGDIRTDAYQNTMTILEAIVDRDDKAKTRPATRAERIAKMHEARKAEADRRAVSQQRDNFVLELGNVLNNRTRRKPSPSTPSPLATPYDL